LQLARWARAEGKPLFGICRGMVLARARAYASSMPFTVDASLPGRKESGQSQPA
jgi:CTP synthase (UTP-ammonia lyase)